MMTPNIKRNNKMLLHCIAFDAKLFFNVSFENALRDLRCAMNKKNIHPEHCYCKKSTLSSELIYADDSDFPTEDSERNRDFPTEDSERNRERFKELQIPF